MLQKKLGAMDTMIFSKEQEEFLNELKQKHGLLDAAIVFAPADIVTDTAIKISKERRDYRNCNSR